MRKGKEKKITTKKKEWTIEPSTGEHVAHTNKQTFQTKKITK